MDEVKKRYVNKNSSNYQRNHAFTEKEFTLSYYKDKLKDAKYVEEFPNDCFRRFYYSKNHDCHYCVIDQRSYENGVRLPNTNEQINVYDPSTVYFLTEKGNVLIKPMTTLFFIRGVIAKNYRIGKYF